jgi:hypothetical protein
MPSDILRDQPLTWRQVAAIAEGAPSRVSDAARGRGRGA